MGIIIWLVVGGVVGWLASLIMRTDAQQGILMNIVVGIVGAVIAALVYNATHKPSEIISVREAERALGSEQAERKS